MIVVSIDEIFKVKKNKWKEFLESYAETGTTDIENYGTKVGVIDWDVSDLTRGQAFDILCQLQGGTNGTKRRG